MFLLITPSFKIKSTVLFELLYFIFSTTPSFNVVGAAPENQLAQAIGEKESEPLRAYVVTNEITNAQALERNIINESTIG